MGLGSARSLELSSSRILPYSESCGNHPPKRFAALLGKLSVWSDAVAGYEKGQDSLKEVAMQIFVRTNAYGDVWEEPDLFAQIEEAEQAEWDVRPYSPGECAAAEGARDGASR